MDNLSDNRCSENTGANRNTIKIHLKKLVETGHLTRRGVGRGTWYDLKKD